MAPVLMPPPEPTAATARAAPGRGPSGLAAGAAPAHASPACVSSESLFGGAQELLITHAGAVYRLRITSLGKLILTK
jgi:hemin uptake protein HemP